MALRGDPPRARPNSKRSPEASNTRTNSSPDPFGILRRMGIGHAGISRTPPGIGRQLDSDIRHLKQKVDAECGRGPGYAQLFYVNDHFLRFRERSSKGGGSAFQSSRDHARSPSSPG